MQDKYLLRMYVTTTVLASCELIVADLTMVISLPVMELVAMLTMPILWLLWATCSAYDKAHSLWKPILLWLIIDLSALAISTWTHDALIHSARDTPAVYLIIFFPATLAVMAMAICPYLSEVCGTILRGADVLLPSTLQHSYVADWLDFSILSALSCAAPIYSFRVCNLILKLWPCYKLFHTWKHSN